MSITRIVRKGCFVNLPNHPEFFLEHLWFQKMVDLDRELKNGAADQDLGGEPEVEVHPLDIPMNNVD
jgi:hypothetical protein